MTVSSRRRIVDYTMSQELAGRRGQPRQLAIKVRLDTDEDGLVRQLAAAALNSKSKPRRATMAHGAVVLTIIQEGQPG